mmetsp:Transcript_44051/g.89012  ORF Transcript_44051/g.89012 Transcript_44051/m.89012 type:complete len:94 (+) Transcript_44051:1127-1408(+)
MYVLSGKRELSQESIFTALSSDGDASSSAASNSDISTIKAGDGTSDNNDPGDIVGSWMFENAEQNELPPSMRAVVVIIATNERVICFCLASAE